jgi:hypothetical protein
MLSLEHPEIMSFLAEAGSGLWPLRSPKLGLAIAVKGGAELAFAAKHKKAFKFHFYRLQVGNKAAVGVITAVYDFADAPITIQTVCMDSVMQSTMLEVASSEMLPFYFFDFHNSELFGGRWQLKKSAEAIELLRSITPNVAPSERLDFYVALKQQFLEPGNDGLVIEATLAEQNRPENIAIIHVTEEDVLSRRGEGYGIYQSKLGIDKNPGEFQEAEIARLLARIYPPGQVVVNPEIRKGQEFCDVLAIGPHEAIAIQAKSTIQDVRRFEESREKRERRLTKHFYDALSQARGAERAFYKLKRRVSFVNTDLPITPETKLLIHVIILYNKPSNLLDEWSTEFAKFTNELTPAAVLELSEFTNMISVYKSRESFLSALITIADSFLSQKRIRSYEFGKEKIACL